jgi:hypothetical protein
MRNHERTHPIAASLRCLAVTRTGRDSFGTHGVSFCFRAFRHDGDHEAALRNGEFILWRTRRFPKAVTPAAGDGIASS